MMKARRILVFDLETQRSFAEVGGPRGIPHMGISIAVVYDMAQQRFHLYYETDVPRLVQELEQADLVVGFNLLRFDYLVLSGYIGRSIAPPRTLDMLADIERRLGFRLKLDTLTRYTLGIRKSADGLMALRWWREGRLDLIRDYCIQDVEVTRQLYEFGRDNGYVVYWDRRLRALRRLPVEWHLF